MKQVFVTDAGVEGYKTYVVGGVTLTLPTPDEESLDEIVTRLSAI